MFSIRAYSKKLNSDYNIMFSIRAYSKKLNLDYVPSTIAHST